MRRPIVVCLFGLIGFLPLSVQGQSGTSAPQPFAVGHPSLPPFADTPQSVFFVVEPFDYFYSPFISPMPIFSPPLYSPFNYPTPIHTVPAYVPPPPTPSLSQRDEELAHEIRRLTQEVEQLRQAQASRQSRQASAEAPPPVQTLATPTTLVFKDGRRLEIHNYAMVGQALWALDGGFRKIPLADLDLDATQKENRERGVRFVPKR